MGSYGTQEQPFPITQHPTTEEQLPHQQAYQGWPPMEDIMAHLPPVTMYESQVSIRG